jgi:predicted HicB family RNase H-like nuclease
VGKHEETLEKMLQHSRPSNLTWADVESLLEHHGAKVKKRKGSAISISLKGYKAYFHRPHPDDKADKGAIETASELLEKGRNLKEGGVNRRDGMLTYEGYIGRVDFDENAHTFFGTVINANVLISFRGSTVDDLEKSFHDVVDSYLDDCKEKGVSPEKPYNGTITVRVTPEVHRRVAIKASACKESMNKYVERLLEKDTADLQ